MADYSTTALQGFTIYQPTLGAALQFFPALGSAELDSMIQAYLPGPASIKDKRATICMDFYEYAGRTGETMKFYAIFPASYTPVATDSPVGSDYASAFSASPVVNDMNMWSFTAPSTPSSVAAATPSSTQAAKPERKSSLVARSRQDFSHMPGMKILTKDGVDVTNSATRGSKTKEQRDHAHLMRIIKACDACKKRKTRCDPSHKKRSAAQSSQSSSPPATKSAKKTKVAAPSPPQLSANTSFIIPDMSMGDFSDLDLGMDAFASLGGLEALNDFNYDPSWDQQFVNYDQDLAATADYDFLFGLDAASSSPSASSGSFYSSNTSASSSSHSSPSQTLIPSFEPVTDRQVTGRPAICSRQATEGLAGYSQAANSQDMYSRGASAAAVPSRRPGDAQIDSSIRNVDQSNRSPPDGQDLSNMAGLVNLNSSFDRSRQNGNSFGRMPDLARSAGVSLQQVQTLTGIPDAPLVTHDGRPDGDGFSSLADLQRHSAGIHAPRVPTAAGLSDGQRPNRSSRLQAQDVSGLAQSADTLIHALGRSGPVSEPAPRVPGGPGLSPGLPRPVADNMDRIPASLASAADSARLRRPIASYATSTGVQQTAVALYEARQSESPLAGSLVSTRESAGLQVLQSNPCLGPSQAVALLVVGFGLCAFFSLWQLFTYSSQFVLFAAPFAAELRCKGDADKCKPSTADRQVSGVVPRLGDLWRTARLSMRV